MKSTNTNKIQTTGDHPVAIKSANPPSRLLRCLAMAALAGFASSVSADELTPTITTRGDGKTVATFSTAGTGTWTIPAGVSSVEVLVVGGGGGGSVWAGGSGGGGMYYTSSYAVTPGSVMAITVGVGGTAGGGDANGGDGQLSQFGSMLVANGGIHGMGYSTAGGGNQGGYSLDGGITIVPGSAPAEPRDWGWWSGSGAGAPGTVGDSAAGGNGAACSITGTSVDYAGGGGANANGVGGLGGGGDGAYEFGGPSHPGYDGLGGGAGGGWGGTGANGGSGVVILAYYDSSVMTYTVSFISNGGSPVSDQIVQSGNTATQPTAPTKTGYTFVEWCSDIALTTAFNFSTPITVDTTIYAKWTINSYTLTYNADSNGMIDGITPQTVEYLGSGTAVHAMPNSGYQFVKWSDDSTVNPRTDSNVTADITVTASFEMIPPPFPAITTRTTDGHTLATFYQGSGTWTVPAGVTSVEVLVIGGGGGAGAQLAAPVPVACITHLIIQWSLEIISTLPLVPVEPVVLWIGSPEPMAPVLPSVQ